MTSSMSLRPFLFHVVASGIQEDYKESTNKKDYDQGRVEIMDGTVLSCLFSDFPRVALRDSHWYAEFRVEAILELTPYSKITRKRNAY